MKKRNPQDFPLNVCATLLYVEPCDVSRLIVGFYKYDTATVDSALSNAVWSLHYMSVQQWCVCKTSPPPPTPQIYTHTHTLFISRALFLSLMCVHVFQCGVIIYDTPRPNEAVSHNAYSLTWWVGPGQVWVMSVEPLQIYSKR